MKKIIILMVLIGLSSVALAQQKPVQITGGSISVSGTNNLSGNGMIQTPEFTSNFQIYGSDHSHWLTDCRYVGCGVGSTFRVPQAYAFANTVRRNVSSIINGQTYAAYHNAYGININANIFIIPRMTRRKGGFVLRQPFQLQGRYLICRIDPWASGCPPEDVLFDKLIEGQGTLTIYGKIEPSQNVENIRPRFYIERFEYTFEQ